MNHIPLIDLIDSEKDKTAFVCGTGQSLKKHLNRLRNKSESKKPIILKLRTINDILI